MAKKKRVKTVTKVPTQAKTPSQIEFEYLKSNLFRVIPIDGAFGGLSPNGREIHMALFNERRAIPKKTVHPITPEGTLGKETVEKREGRSSFVREIEIDVVLDLPTAIVLQTWLQDKIQQMAKTHGIELKQVADAAAAAAAQTTAAAAKPKRIIGAGSKVVN